MIDFVPGASVPSPVINRGSGTDRRSSTPLQTPLGRVAETRRLLTHSVFHRVCVRPVQYIEKWDWCSAEWQWLPLRLRSCMWSVLHALQCLVQHFSHTATCEMKSKFPPFTFQVESGTLHGAFSTKEKNVNHIVPGVLAEQVCWASPRPSPKVLLQNEILFWSWPKSIELWNKISFV